MYSLQTADHRHCLIMQLEKYEKREKNRVTDSTVRSRMSALNKFKEFANPDGEPTVEDVEEWVDHMVEKYENGEMKAGTIKQYFKAVRYYYQIIHADAEDIEHIREWIPVGDTDHGDFLEHDELDQLREAAYAFREKTIIEMMYWYARRPGEIILLNMDDVNMENGTITFPILKKDDNSFRATYELLPEVEKKLKQYLKYRSSQTVEGEQPWEGEEVEPLFTTKHGRISYSTVWRRIKEIAERTDIDKNITPKSMRHTRTTHLDWSGQNPEIIARQQLVHDADSDVVSAYIHPRDEEQVREVMMEDGS